VLVIGGPPGSLPVSPFEYWYAAQGPYSRGEYDAAVAVASEGLAQYPDHPTLHYQLACYHALAGHRDDALEHLRVAEAGNPRVLEWANDDSDLDSLRDDPRYPG
jgi:tetratricopeptide (TPR) repeat protein